MCLIISHLSPVSATHAKSYFVVVVVMHCNESSPLSCWILPWPGLEAKYFMSLQVCVNPETAEEKSLVLILNRTIFAHPCPCCWTDYLTWLPLGPLGLSHCHYSVAKSCLTLCNPMHVCIPGSFVFRYLLEFAPFTSTEAVMLTILSSAAHFSFSLQSFPESGSFPVNRLFASGGQSIGASASASVLPVTIQGWFPLGWTGLISLQSKGFSGVFSSTTIRKHHFFGTQPSWWSNLHIHTWLLEDP